MGKSFKTIKMNPNQLNLAISFFISPYVSQEDNKTESAEQLENVLSLMMNF